MEIKKASYVISSPDMTKCPKGDKPEYAFIGRSNVGKSSLINMLTGQSKLAKTSGSPGKTQMINHFTITSASEKLGNAFEWYLVDLPGYGYAKVSQKMRRAWEQMISDYLQKRENLVNVFVLIDGRHGPQQNDLDFIAQLGDWQIPFNLVFTKADKTTQKEVGKNVRAFVNKMKEEWEFIPRNFVTSAEKFLGKKELLLYIDELNQEAVKPEEE